VVHQVLVYALLRDNGEAPLGWLSFTVIAMY
jgi:hypothetical protein